MMEWWTFYFAQVEAVDGRRCLNSCSQEEVRLKLEPQSNVFILEYDVPGAEEMAQLIKYHTNISACIQILKPDSQHPGKTLDTAAMYCNPSSVDLETRGCYWSGNLVPDSEKESFQNKQTKKHILHI